MTALGELGVALSAAVDSIGCGGEFERDLGFGIGNTHPGDVLSEETGFALRRGGG